MLRPGLKLFLPASTNVAEDVDVWFPSGLSDRVDVSQPGVMARLAPGATLAQANAELETFGAAFATNTPAALCAATRGSTPRRRRIC